MQVSAGPIWALLRTVFGSISEVGLLCVAGYVLARQGILDKKTQKHINRLNVSLFTPSLLFSKVAFSLTPEKLKELWAIPILFVVTTGCSMLVAFTVGSILRLRRSQRNFAMAASMFMNSNSLPIALMQSIVYSVQGLRWGDDDNEDAMLGRALTYLVLYSTMGMMVRWSYGVHLLSQSDVEIVPSTPYRPSRVSETTPLLPDADASANVPISPTNRPRRPPSLFLANSFDSSSSRETMTPEQPYGSASIAPGDRVPLSPRTARSVVPKHFSTFPNTPVYSRTDGSESELTDDDEGQELPSGDVPVRHMHYARFWHHLRFLIHKVNAFMTVPMWAALASIIVACTRPLEHALVQHMQPLRSALTSAGNCSIPLTLVVLGAYFHVPEPDDKAHGEHRRRVKTHRSDASLIQSVREIFVRSARRKKISRAGIVPSDADTDGVKRPGETRTVVAAVLSRMVLTPLILLPLLALFMESGATAVFEDPVFALSNVLLITSAPALTLAQITQAASGDAFERLISRTIFWAYCVVTPVSTIVAVVIGLVLAKA